MFTRLTSTLKQECPRTDEGITVLCKNCIWNQAQTTFSTLLHSSTADILPSTVRCGFCPVAKVPLNCLLKHMQRCYGQPKQHRTSHDQEQAWLSSPLACCEASPRTPMEKLLCIPGGLADLQWSVDYKLGIKCIKVFRKKQVRTNLSWILAISVIPYRKQCENSIVHCHLAERSS